jgi:hypothetical protein
MNYTAVIIHILFFYFVVKKTWARLDSDSLNPDQFHWFTEMQPCDKFAVLII